MWYFFPQEKKLYFSQENWTTRESKHFTKRSSTLGDESEVYPLNSEVPQDW